MNKVVPILKWAGGKRQLLPEIIPLFPSEYKCYYEPFVGAGAVLFAALPQNAVINDSNLELINIYNVIKDCPDDLIKLLKKYEAKHSDEFYYSMRDMDRNVASFAALSNLKKAARSIYLNRTCYNGLYRVNKQGFFNTPIGKNSSVQIINEKGIYAINKYLNEANIQILAGDYTQALKGVTAEDFVFLDPPYYPTSRESFLRYDINPFNVDKQKALKSVCDNLNAMGVKFIETNSDCPEVKELYEDYRQISVNVRRCINAQADGRTGTELIIYNF